MKTVLVVFPYFLQNEVEQLITAAMQIRSDEIEVWAMDKSLQCYTNLPVKKIVYFNGVKQQHAIFYLPYLEHMYSISKPEAILFYHDEIGSELSGLLRSSLALEGISDVIQIKNNNNNIMAVKRLFASHVEGEFLIKKYPLIISIAKNSFEMLCKKGSPKIEACNKTFGLNYFENYVETKLVANKTPNDFDIVLIGGRGIGSAKNMLELENLAKAMGAGLGCTRPVVLNGWLPETHLVGVSGHVIKPKLCITFGVSGCAPFVKGIDRSKCIISIDNNPDALIWDKCDAGIICDCMEVIRRMQDIVKKSK